MYISILWQSDRLLSMEGACMSDPRSLMKMLRLLTYLTQLGLSVISPIVLSVLLGVWLNLRFGVGHWLTVVLLLVGLVSGGCAFYRFAKGIIKLEKENPPHDGEGEWYNEN